MNTVALEKFAVPAGGSVDPSKYPSEEFDLYSIPAYDKYEPEVSQGSEIGSTKKTVQPGDVLLSRIVPHIRRVWVVGPSRGRRQVGSGEWIIFRGDSFDSNYLRHMLMADPFHKQFMQTVAGVGGSLLRARPSEVEKIKIPLPPLPEQKRIAAILDKADAIRRKRQQTVKLTEELLRSVFLDMFGDPVTNPKGWETCCLGDVIQKIESGWSPVCEEGQAEENKWGVLKLGAVTTCRYLDTESKSLPAGTSPRPELEVMAGDLLFTRKNTYDLVAASALVYATRPKLMLSDLIFRLKLKDDSAVISEYLWALLSNEGKRKQIQSLAGGSSGSMPNISKSKLMEQMIEVPPMLLQKKYANILHLNRNVRIKLEAASQTSDSLFTSLLQQAFRGEL